MNMWLVEGDRPRLDPKVRIVCELAVCVELARCNDGWMGDARPTDGAHLPYVRLQVVADIL